MKTYTLRCEYKTGCTDTRIIWFLLKIVNEKSLMKFTKSKSFFHLFALGRPSMSSMPLCPNASGPFSNYLLSCLALLDLGSMSIFWSSGSAIFTRPPIMCIRLKYQFKSSLSPTLWPKVLYLFINRWIREKKIIF